MYLLAPFSFKDCNTTLQFYIALSGHCSSATSFMILRYFITIHFDVMKDFGLNSIYSIAEQSIT